MHEQQITEALSEKSSKCNLISFKSLENFIKKIFYADSNIFVILLPFPLLELRRGLASEPSFFLFERA